MVLRYLFILNRCAGISCPNYGDYYHFPNADLIYLGEKSQRNNISLYTNVPKMNPLNCVKYYFYDFIWMLYLFQISKSYVRPQFY